MKPWHEAVVETQRQGMGAVSASPTAAIPHRYSAVREIHSAGFRRETHQSPCFLPWHGYPGLSRPGGGGDPAREVIDDMPRQERGRSAPSPSAPPPRRRFSMDTPPRRASPLCRQREHPAKIQFPSPLARYPDYRHRLPAPSGGGGRRPRQRPGGGGDPARKVSSDTRRQGKGRSAPSPSAPPHGGDSP